MQSASPKWEPSCSHETMALDQGFQPFSWKKLQVALFFSSGGSGPQVLWFACEFQLNSTRNLHILFILANSQMRLTWIMSNSWPCHSFFFSLSSPMVPFFPFPFRHQNGFPVFQQPESWLGDHRRSLDNPSFCGHESCPLGFLLYFISHGLFTPLQSQ